MNLDFHPDAETEFSDPRRAFDLGAAYTFKLGKQDVLSRAYWCGKNRIKATVLVRNKDCGGVRAAANEDGGDGTVRISGPNPDARLTTADFSGDDEPVWRVTNVGGQPPGR